MAENQQPPARYTPIQYLTPYVGNIIASISGPDSDDVFSIATPDRRGINPVVTYARRSGTSLTTYSKLGEFQLSSGYRFSRIAVNKRDLPQAGTQTSVFYQGYTGDVYEIRLNAAGVVYYVGRIDTIPATESRAETTNAPRLGTSFATVLYGQERDTVLVFYQAQDNRIYVVSQKALGRWTEPSLVSLDPTTLPTTLCALTWQESVGGTTNDGVALIFNQSPSQYKVLEVRYPRDDIGTVTPLFEVVCQFNAPETRGPFSAIRLSEPGDNLETRYQIYAQRSSDPARIFELWVTVRDGLLPQLRARDIVSQTVGYYAPVRCASIAAVLRVASGAAKSNKYEVAVAWTTKEGRVLGGTLSESSSLVAPGPADKDAKLQPGPWADIKS